MHPHMLRQSFVTTMRDAGVDPRDVQIARHARLRTTVAYDRARANLDHRPSYILAAFMTVADGPPPGAPVGRAVTAALAR